MTIIFVSRDQLLFFYLDQQRAINSSISPFIPSIEQFNTNFLSLIVSIDLINHLINIIFFRIDHVICVTIARKLIELMLIDVLLLGAIIEIELLIIEAENFLFFKLSLISPKDCRLILTAFSFNIRIIVGKMIFESADFSICPLVPRILIFSDEEILKAFSFKSVIESFASKLSQLCLRVR